LSIEISGVSDWMDRGLVYILRKHKLFTAVCADKSMRLG
jgi:hypothetical protein